MIATRLDGSELKISVGQPLTGIGLKAVTLTAEDICHPNFLKWAQSCLFTRFATHVAIQEDRPE